jgi:hypothetical protein
MCELKASRVPIQHYDQMKHLEIAQVSKKIKITLNKTNLTLKIKTNKRLNRKLFNLNAK